MIKKVNIFASYLIIFCLSICCIAGQSKDSNQVKKGTGAWIYGINPRFVNEINTYNKSVINPEKKILYLFCYMGSVETGLLVGFDGSIAAYYKKNLPDCEIYANIDGYPSINGLSESKIVLLAKEIANKVNTDPNIAGLHLDIEPYEPTQLQLMEEYKNHTSKPVNLSIDVDSPLSNKLFNLTNFVVLMNYDLGKDPVTYNRRSKEGTRVILESAIKNKGKVMIGLPFIATHHEYQYTTQRKNIQVKTQSGYTMADFLKGGFEGSQDVVNKIGNTNFIGVSIWAFLGEDDPVHSESLLYYPASIGLDEWQLLLKDKK